MSRLDCQGTLWRNNNLWNRCQLCENTRRWAAEHPHSGPVNRNAEELRQLIAEKELQRAEQPAPKLEDEPIKPEKS